MKSLSSGPGAPSVADARRLPFGVVPGKDGDAHGDGSILTADGG